ncbi:hypothetical protein ACFX5Q_22980 [Mesorhizobium sp. IMUNJ 23033]|uniref:hypothetical protein n=1 Tax=Mesorhizobium sp. IMUNJ 23033 TaxID=3378039 RepID=UPI00384E9643
MHLDPRIDACADAAQEKARRRKGVRAKRAGPWIDQGGIALCARCRETIAHGRAPPHLATLPIAIIIFQIVNVNFAASRQNCVNVTLRTLLLGIAAKDFVQMLKFLHFAGAIKILYRKNILLSNL